MTTFYNKVIAVLAILVPAHVRGLIAFPHDFPVPSVHPRLPPSRVCGSGPWLCLPGCSETSVSEKSDKREIVIDTAEYTVVSTAGALQLSRLRQDERRRRGIRIDLGEYAVLRSGATVS